MSYPASNVNHFFVLQCDVDGGFGEFYDVTACTKSCGGGTKQQRRECNNPTPVGDGQPCVGDATRTVDCNTQAVSKVSGIDMKCSGNKLPVL